MTKLSRREFETALAAFLGGTVAGYVTRPDENEAAAMLAGGSENTTTLNSMTINEFQFAESAADLDEPDKTPAVAITLDEGLVVFQ